jgi:predicted acyl esterase
MKPSLYTIALLALTLTFTAGAQTPPTPAPAKPLYPAYPSETPEKFTPSAADHDYVRRVVMIPMRDGVKLHTVILVPRGA